MYHHQKTNSEHIQFLGSTDVLGADVSLGHMGGHADGVDTQIANRFQVLYRADAGDQQYVQFGGFDAVGSGSDQVQFIVLAEAVVVTGAGKTVAMGNLDHEHAAFIQSGSNGTHLIGRITVGNGVGTVSEGGIDNTDLLHIMLPPSEVCRQFVLRRQWRRR